MTNATAKRGTTMRLRVPTPAEHRKPLRQLHDRRRARSERRQQLLDHWRPQYTELGFDFTLLLLPELRALAKELSIAITAKEPGQTPRKADYVYGVERHFALERANNIGGHNKAGYGLFLRINPARETKATIRQILARFDHLRWLDDGRATTDVTHYDLGEFYNHHWAEMFWYSHGQEMTAHQRYLQNVFPC